ncbi:MAG TPA: Crp/Fnr family transcriptional regulator [Candidatus Marinimicrobia bacterium]|nr:Crp/Fnr family transcriptional regulator [Candidatus Neomarinimicrobiota bacterium]
MNKIELLQSVSLFWDLTEKELGYISEKMVLRHYEAGQMILLEASEGEQCFFVTEGSVKITRLSKEGREVILAILNDGDFFGEMSLLDGESRSANVIALDDTKVLTLNRNDFLLVIKEYPQIAIQLLKEMALRLRKSDRQIASLSLSDAEKRIALCILRIAEEQGVIQKGHVSIPKAPIQQDIANMSGTSRETVSRALKLLEKEGFIQRNGRELLINNYNKFIEEFDS